MTTDGQKDLDNDSQGWEQEGEEGKKRRWKDGNTAFIGATWARQAEDRCA